MKRKPQIEVSFFSIHYYKSAFDMRIQPLMKRHVFFNDVVDGSDDDPRTFCLCDFTQRQAEEFIKTFEEVENRSLTMEEMKDTFHDWASEVKRLFYKLSDTEPVPVEHTKWADTIMDLAGWVTDLALYIERTESDNSMAERWMMKHAVNHYYKALDLLREKCGNEIC